MTEQKQQPSSKLPIPRAYWAGQDLDWEATSVPVELRIELPYWLMVPDCTQDVQVHEHTFEVDIKENYIELYPAIVTDSRNSCVYIGPPRKTYPPNLQELVKKTKVNVVARKCKTVLLIHSQCNEDVLVAFKEQKRKNSSYLYLRSFCEAHFEIINHLIKSYRLATYDYFAFELSPWDVPIWFVGSGIGAATIILQDYAGFDDKPFIVTNVPDGRGERYKLIEPEELKKAMAIQPSAGEFELQDALNFMERGDYSDAVRRITTAIEAQTEEVLRQELLKLYPMPEVERRLKRTEANFPLRLIQYQKLSGRKLSDTFDMDLKRTRALRHSIVHKGNRITFGERGNAQRAVDTGRWIFNWLENQPDRRDVREKIIGKRSIGRHRSLYDAEITSAGVIVHKPHGN